MEIRDLLDVLTVLNVLFSGGTFVIALLTYFKGKK